MGRIDLERAGIVKLLDEAAFKDTSVKANINLLIR
jgi:hypothetical protein